MPQQNRDKYSAWEDIQFDVMFVGDDWKGNKLFEDLEHRFKYVGVDIVYFPYTQGTSSTILRKKII